MLEPAVGRILSAPFSRGYVYSNVRIIHEGKWKSTKTAHARDLKGKRKKVGLELVTSRTRVTHVSESQG